MKTLGSRSGYGRGTVFVMLLILALAAGIAVRKCGDKDGKDAGGKKTAETPTVAGSKKDADKKETAKKETVMQNMKKEPFTNSIGMKFVYIPPGTFMMGSPGTEKMRVGDGRERQHRVTLTRGFFMQTTPVTEKQWMSVMKTRGKYNLGDDYPRTMVSWNQAREFVAELNRKEGTALYRLPTEAEWEYSCRAGSSAAFCFGDDESRLSEYAWYEANAAERVGADGTKTLMSPAGLLKPNAWGLYDMHGNVQELCHDNRDTYRSGDDVTDPEGGGPIVRGCSFYSDYFICRAAFRKGSYGIENHGGIAPGFRVARSAE